MAGDTPSVSGARGTIRTYNPLTTYEVDIKGFSDAWVMLARGSGTPDYAQIGWDKSAERPDPTEVKVFSQISRAGAPAETTWSVFNIFAPDPYVYQIDTDRAGVWHLNFNGAQFAWYDPSQGFTWAPDRVVYSGEVFNYTGDQLGGDLLAGDTKVRFQLLRWWNQYGEHTIDDPTAPFSLAEGKPHLSSNPTRTWDHAIHYPDQGGMFDMYDARCPN